MDGSGRLCDPVAYAHGRLHPKTEASAEENLPITSIHILVDGATREIAQLDARGVQGRFLCSMVNLVPIPFPSLLVHAPRNVQLPGARSTAPHGGGVRKHVAEAVDGSGPAGGSPGGHVHEEHQFLRR